MDILTLFVVIPVLTILILVFTKDLKQARLVSLFGMLIQFFMAINLVFAYLKEKKVNDFAKRHDAYVKSNEIKAIC